MPLHLPEAQRVRANDRSGVRIKRANLVASAQLELVSTRADLSRTHKSLERRRCVDVAGINDKCRQGRIVALESDRHDKPAARGIVVGCAAGPTSGIARNARPLVLEAADACKI